VTISTQPFVARHGRGVYIATGVRLYAIAPSGDPVRIDLEVQDPGGDGLVLCAKREYESLCCRAAKHAGPRKER
jgi:hypothetical protein